jgi:hypothetical protein
MASQQAGFVACSVNWNSEASCNAAEMDHTDKVAPSANLVVVWRCSQARIIIIKSKVKYDLALWLQQYSFTVTKLKLALLEADLQLVNTLWL